MIDFLFEQGCELIIIACNTASAKALRQLQQKFLIKKALLILVNTKKMLQRQSCTQIAMSTKYPTNYLIIN